MNKPVKTVSVKCACGAAFAREVKRGRPQVWCPSCIAVPFYERTATPAVALAVTDVEVATERIVNENDRLDTVRPDIEAGMAVINADHKVRYAALIAGGMGTFDASDKAQAATLSATLNLYAELAPQFYKPGREIEDV